VHSFLSDHLINFRNIAVVNARRGRIMVRRLVPTERNCVSNILRMLTERNRFRKALTPTRKDWNESRNAEGDSRINAYEDSRINAYEHSRINAYECACDYFSGGLKKKAARVERKDEGTSRSKKTRYLASASWPIYQDPVIHTVHEEFQHDHRSGS
jgi:hypothetical protein